MPLEATLREKACATCGQSFKPRSARQKYCSNVCKRGISTCNQCSRQFVPKGNTTGNFCSSRCWYAWPGRIEDKECPVCNKMFRPKNSKQKTCSYECADKSKRTSDRRTNCKQCGGELRPNVYPKTQFCSRSCAQKFNRNGGRERDDGATQAHSSGYTRIKINGRWILEHRYVMGQMLGRTLEPHERVHHKNGVRNDNRPENLELWTVQKKDPAGQRQLDLVQSIIPGLPVKDKRQLIAWLLEVENELVSEVLENRP